MGKGEAQEGTKEGAEEGVEGTKETEGTEEGAQEGSGRAQETEEGAAQRALFQNFTPTFTAHSNL